MWHFLWFCLFRKINWSFSTWQDVWKNKRCCWNGGLAQVPGAVRAELLRLSSSTLFESSEKSGESIISQEDDLWRKKKDAKMQTMRCESLKDEPWDTKASLEDKGKSQNTALNNSVHVPHHWKLNLVTSQRSIWLQQLWNRCFVHSTCILKSKFRTAARPCSSKMNAPTPTPEPGIVQWTWTFSLRTFANLQCYITLIVL